MHKIQQPSSPSSISSSTEVQKCKSNRTLVMRLKIVIWPDSVLRVTPVDLLVACVTVPPAVGPTKDPAVTSNNEGMINPD